MIDLQPQFEDRGLLPVLDKVQAGQRLDYDDGLALYRSADLLAIGYMANLVDVYKRQVPKAPRSRKKRPRGVHPEGPEAILCVISAQMYTLHDRVSVQAGLSWMISFYCFKCNRLFALFWRKV